MGAASLLGRLFHSLMGRNELDNKVAKGKYPGSGKNLFKRTNINGGSCKAPLGVIFDTAKTNVWVDVMSLRSEALVRNE